MGLLKCSSVYLIATLMRKWKNINMLSHCRSINGKQNKNWNEHHKNGFICFQFSWKWIAHFKSMASSNRNEIGKLLLIRCFVAIVISIEETKVHATTNSPIGAMWNVYDCKLINRILSSLTKRTQITNDQAKSINLSQW